MISIKMTGFEKAKKEVDDIALRAKNTQQGLRVISSKMYKETIQHFSDERGPDYSWEPSQRAIIESGRTLVDTGRMRGSIKPNIKYQVRQLPHDRDKENATARIFMVLERL
jgi:phage gpG-like protein